MQKVLGVPAEALIDCGTTNLSEAFHFLMEMVHIYYLNPKCTGDKIILCGYDIHKESLLIRPILNKIFDD